MKILASVMVVLAGSALVRAQAARPVFEVASIKQNLSGRTPGFNDFVRPGGRFAATNISLLKLIEFAYGVNEVQVVGGPGWVNSDRFDLAATAGQETPIQDMRLMVQSLLEDRFKLALAKEQREMAIHEVTLNRADGRLGSNLVQLSPEDDCASAGAKISAAPGYQKPPAGGAPAVRSGNCGPAPSVFADAAASIVKTPVVDRTGLTGRWAFFTYFGADPTRFPGADNPNLPNFFTSWQEQLGLRLRPTRGMADVLTIESVVRPSEN